MQSYSNSTTPTSPFASTIAANSDLQETNYSGSKPFDILRKLIKLLRTFGPQTLKSAGTRLLIPASIAVHAKWLLLGIDLSAGPSSLTAVFLR